MTSSQRVRSSSKSKDSASSYCLSNNCRWFLIYTPPPRSAFKAIILPNDLATALRWRCTEVCASNSQWINLQSPQLLRLKKAFGLSGEPCIEPSAKRHLTGFKNSSDFLMRKTHWQILLGRRKIFGFFFFLEELFLYWFCPPKKKRAGSKLMP